MFVEKEVVDLTDASRCHNVSGVVDEASAPAFWNWFEKRHPKLGPQKG